MEDIQLSEHFKLSEFERSETATRYGINNHIPESLIPNLKRICQEILEPLREYAGQPIIIGSGYRCPELNAHPDVRGASNSQHLTGEAVDIHIPDTKTGNDWFIWMMSNLRFDQLIKERHTKTSKTFWIHVSLTASNNRQHVICNLIKNK